MGNIRESSNFLFLDNFHSSFDEFTPKNEHFNFCDLMRKYRNSSNEFEIIDNKLAIIYLAYLNERMDIETVVPEKSPNDQRSYEAIVLPNNLKVLLIQDPEIAKSACSISVGRGSFHDP